MVVNGINMLQTQKVFAWLCGFVTFLSVLWWFSECYVWKCRFSPPKTVKVIISLLCLTVTFVLSMLDSSVLPKSINVIKSILNIHHNVGKCVPCCLSDVKMKKICGLRGCFHHLLKGANLLKCFVFVRLRLPNSSSCFLRKMQKSSVYRVSFCPEEPSTMTSQREVHLRRLNH